MRDNPDHRVAALDEALHIIGWNAKSSWYLKGGPRRRLPPLSRKRFHSLGALVDGGFECRFYDRANGNSFIDLLGHLRHKYGKIVVVLDNAAYHKSGGSRGSPGRAAAT